MRQHSGNVGPRSKHPGITGAMGPPISWDPWPARSCERPWGRKSVHRLAKMASRSCFGAFVYTVAPWAWVVGGLGIAIVYTNGRIGPLRAGLGHLCTLLRLARIVRATVGTQECTQIDGNGPLGAVFGAFVYTVATQAASSGTSASTTMVCRRRPLGGHLSLSRETRLCASGAIARLASSRDVNPQTPEKPENSLVPPNKTVHLADEMSRT